jgi:hypothetical protein
MISKKKCGGLAVAVMLFSLSYSSWAQDTRIKFFAQPGFDYAYNKDLKQGSPYFRSGEFVMFVTSQISDRISVSGEANMHYNSSEVAPAVEIERIYLRYLINDNLALRVGKTYNPLGFWNLNYNLGLVLQPTITRPTLLQPNHDGGFTQTRDVGVMLEGQDIGKAGLFFNVFLSNGFGKNGGTGGNSYALGKNVSLTTQLGVEPKEDLKISVSGLVNKLEKGFTNQFNVDLLEDAMYTVGVFSISYMNPISKFEFISEYYVHNRNYNSIGDRNVQGAVLYLGYKTSDKVTPYFYGENINFNGGVDPYYSTINPLTGQGFVNSVRGSLGLRYQFSPSVVLKVEAGYADQDTYGGTYFGKTQLAFSF